LFLLFFSPFLPHFDPCYNEISYILYHFNDTCFELELPLCRFLKETYFRAKGVLRTKFAYLITNRILSFKYVCVCSLASTGQKESSSACNIFIP
jgi:hypothetical protein